MIIGSTAIKHWFSDFPREPKDVDIVKNMYINKYDSDKKVEWLENKILQNWESVKYFPDHNVYIKVTGYYQSYNGTEFYDEWDCCKEVKPQEKTIVVYQ